MIIVTVFICQITSYQVAIKPLLSFHRLEFSALQVFHMGIEKQVNVTFYYPNNNSI